MNENEILFDLRYINKAFGKLGDDVLALAKERDELNNKLDAANALLKRQEYKLLDEMNTDDITIMNYVVKQLKNNDPDEYWDLYQSAEIWEEVHINHELG